MQRKSMATQMKDKVKKPIKKKKYDGNIEVMISTGSTLLDLAISGTRIRGGGIPGGIAVEIFGDSAAGKTVLLCEIGGAIQRNGGDLIFNDPEARLNKKFAELFDLTITDKTIKRPDTVAEIFALFENWEPKGDAPHGIIADSIAALSTEDEMKDAKGYDGAKRANDFSTGFRRTCRMLERENNLMVFSNQIRDVMGAMPFQEKTKATGGHAPKFYASLRLQIKQIKKIRRDKTVHGKKHTNTDGIESEIYVYKSSVDKPYRKAPVHIIFDYGIDDIRANLIYLKQNSSHKKYMVDGVDLGSSITDAIAEVETQELEPQLKEDVIDLWEEIQDAFKVERKRKVR